MDPSDFVSSWNAELRRRGISDGLEYLRSFLSDVGRERDPTEVAHGLRSIAESFEEAGQPQEAVAAYEEVHRRFGDAPEGEIVEHVVASLVRRANLLLLLGYGAQAVRDLADLAATYGDDASPEIVQTWISIALYDKAAAFCAEGLRARDVAPAMLGVTFYDELDARFRAAPSPSVQEWVAKGRYNKGDALAVMNQVAPAREAFEDVVGRFGGSGDETLHEVAAYAAVRARMLIEIPPPPSGLHPTAIGWRAELIHDRESTDDPEAAAEIDRGLVAVDRFAAAHHSAVQASHETAVKVLTAYMAQAAPFALLLRTFDLEGFFRDVPAPEHLRESSPDIGVALGAATPSRFEQFLVTQLGDSVPVISVCNRGVVLGSLTAAIPRIVLPDTRWETIVEHLVANASFVFMDADRLSPGVERELGLLRQHHREADTVVVLPSDDPDSQERFLERYYRVAGEFYGLDQSEYEPLEEGHAALAGFPRVVAEDLLVEEGLARSSAVADLIARTREVMALDPQERVSMLVAQAAAELRRPRP